MGKMKWVLRKLFSQFIDYLAYSRENNRTAPFSNQQENLYGKLFTELISTLDFNLKNRRQISRNIEKVSVLLQIRRRCQNG